MSVDLVTIPEYRALTCDEITDDGTVSALLDMSIDIIGEECDRFLKLDTYTETLDIRPGWLVYPHGVPITVAPSGTQPRMYSYAIWGVTTNAFNDPSFVFPIDIPYYGDAGFAPGTNSEWFEWNATVTYTGGFDHDTLPPGLRLLIAQLAYGLKAKPASNTAGARVLISATVGDVNAQYSSKSLPMNPGIIDLAVPGMSTMLRRYRRPTGT